MDTSTVVQSQISLVFPFKYLLYIFDVISIENNVTPMARVYFVTGAVLFSDLEETFYR
jgi:hypothetical protein